MDVAAAPFFSVFPPQWAWRSLFLTYKLWLNWVQTTGQVLVSEWLWADAFTVAFCNSNFLFSSQKKWCPPFPSPASNTNTITLPLIATFLWLGKAASPKWTQIHPTTNSVMQIPPDSTESLCSICKCSWLCCPAQICQQIQSAKLNCSGISSARNSWPKNESILLFQKVHKCTIFPQQTHLSEE